MSKEGALRFGDKRVAALPGYADAEKTRHGAVKTLGDLDAKELKAADLEPIGSAFAKARDGFQEAACQAFDAAYPGLEKQLGGGNLAKGYFALHNAQWEYPDCPRVKELVARYDPDRKCFAITELISNTRTRAEEYATVREAVKACNTLNDATARCTRLATDVAYEKRAVALLGIGLVRRAAAHDAANRPIASLADAGQACGLGLDEDVRPIIDGAIEHVVNDLSKALETKGRAVPYIEQVGGQLSGDGFAGIRKRLTEALVSADFAGNFLGDRVLVRAWMRNVGPILRPGMIRVPTGRFPLGRDYTGLVSLTPSSAPQHMVKLSEYFIGIREVTNEEFQEFVGAGGYRNDAYWLDAPGVDRGEFTDDTSKPGPMYWHEGRFPEGEGKLPVAGVSWYEASAYARWAGKSLPTEAQWECAAVGVLSRGGNGNFGKQAFPWGGRYEPGSANLRDAGVGKPCPVGSYDKDRSVVGCFDMTGNVREWTSGTFDPYPETVCRDREFGQGLAVVRGAAYSDSSVGTRLTRRRARSRETRDALTGFRCAWLRFRQ